MKSIPGILLIFVLMIVLFSNKGKEQNDYSLAHVGEFDGKYIFPVCHHAIPHHPYDTVF